MAERIEGVFEHEKESFSTFLYNKNEGTVMGRTGSSWAKIGVFYLIFYSFLAGFFAVMMAIFLQTLDFNFSPTYTPSPHKDGSGGGSLLQNPALGFQPTPRKKNVESTLIWYRSADLDDVEYWTSTLDKFIEPYERGRNSSGQHMVSCSEDDPANEAEDDRVCNFQDLWLGEHCQKNEAWGYRLNQPCVLLKLNKMINWKPDVYTSLDELPSEMPEDLRTHITELTGQNDNKVPKIVWVSCQGENPADREYIGPINYMPVRGFHSYYFPYRKTPESVKKDKEGKGYLSPLVSVAFMNPQPYVLINIECRAWAKNIKHDRGNRLGLVHFELLLD